MTRRAALMIAAGSLVLALLPSGVMGADPQAAKPSDFNGDGYIDLAIGARNDAVKAGAVNVLYGSATGLTAQGDDYWILGRDGLSGAANGIDEFGWTAASGDFDRDGYADLAVSAPADLIDSVPVRGSVTIIYGTSHGLSAVGSQFWTEADLGSLLGAEGSFGRGLAAGDYDGDGFSDLAVGVGFRAVGSVQGAGAVDVLFGSSDGITAAGALQITRDTPYVPGEPGEGQNFGSVLEAGDLSDDGIDDLAIGIPSHGVIVMYGTTDGPGAAGSQLWTDATPGMPGDPEGLDWFGQALGIGDFDRDGHGDLAIGAPLDVVGGIMAGSVTVIHGSPAGLTADGLSVWHQGVSGIPGSNETFDMFGYALATGDFDSDGAIDLAVGAYGEAVGSIRGAGAVTLLYGSPTGITAVESVTLTQNSAGVPGKAEEEDLFGFALAAGDYGRSGRDDLAIGVYKEDTAVTRNAGAVDVLYGRLTGLSGKDSQSWSQASPGVKGSPARSDYFGWALTP